MALNEDSSSLDKPNTSSLQPHEDSNGFHYAEKLKTLGEETAGSWIAYAVQQAILAQRTIESVTENVISSTKTRLDRVRTTSSAHFDQTLVSCSFFPGKFSVKG